MLAEDHPLGLLTYASGLLNAIDPRNNSRSTDRRPTPRCPPLPSCSTPWSSPVSPRPQPSLVVHARLAGQDVLVVAMVDVNLGTIVKDAFYSDQSLEGFNEIWHQQELTGITAIEGISLADAPRAALPTVRT